MISAWFLLLLLLPLTSPHKETLYTRADLIPSSCITKTRGSAQQRDHNDDLNTGNHGNLELEERGAKKWNGQKVVYEIVNSPACSDQLSKGDVKRIIDAAAATWNGVTLANVLLVNKADMSPEEGTNSDIKISFQPCLHKDPNQPFDLDFDPCKVEYAHAIHFGDIHLNTLMTWSEKSDLTESATKQGDPVRPNLYSIVLHELGHALGLSHTQTPKQVMHGVFGGDRKYSLLKLGDEDVRRIRALYPINTPWECRDKSPSCSIKSLNVCESEDTRTLCPGTCGFCSKCDANTPDVYLKCSPDICSGNLKEFCKKTCNLCGGISPSPPTCTGLPRPAPKLTSSAEFPVVAGTRVDVKCETGFVLVGDAVLTCVEGETYSFTTPPKCELEEEEGPAQLVTCKDTYSQCNKLLKKKRRKCTNKFMKKKCRKTCKMGC